MRVLPLSPSGGHPSRRRARATVTLSLWLAGAAGVAQVSDSGLAQLEAGRDAFAQQRFSVAVQDFRVASFALLDRPPRLLESLARLAVAQSKAGSPAEEQKATLKRFLSVQQRFKVYGDIDLEPEIRGPFESLLRREFPEEAAAALPKLGESSATAKSFSPGPATGVAARANESSLAPTATATPNPTRFAAPILRSAPTETPEPVLTEMSAPATWTPMPTLTSTRTPIPPTATRVRTDTATPAATETPLPPTSTPVSTLTPTPTMTPLDSDSHSNRDSDADQDPYSAINRHLGPVRYRDADRNENSDGDIHAGPADCDEDARPADGDSTSDGRPPRRSRRLRRGRPYRRRRLPRRSHRPRLDLRL